jgi:hypothetical protein
VDSGATTTTKGGGGAGDSAATLLNMSKMDTPASTTRYTAPIRHCHSHLSWPARAFVAGDRPNFLQQMHNNGMTLSYERRESRKSRVLHPTIDQAVGGCIHSLGMMRPQSRHRDIRPQARLFFSLCKCPL